MASKSSVKTILKVEKVPMAIQAISLVAEEVADDMYKHGTMNFKGTILQTGVSITFRDDQDFCVITFHSEKNTVRPSFHTYRYRYND